MNRKLFWGVLVIGVVLVVAPFAISLPSRSAAGQRMLNDFQPIMQHDPGVLLVLLAAFGLWGEALELRIHRGARPTHA